MMTRQDINSTNAARDFLEDRLARIFITVGTNEMNGIGSIAACFFRRIRKRSSAGSGRWPQLNEMIFLFLSIPRFKVGNLLLKVVYMLQQRELIRLGRECARLRG